MLALVQTIELAGLAIELEAEEIHFPVAGPESPVAGLQRHEFAKN